MHAWVLWTIHLLLSAGIVAGYTVFYEAIWRQGGRLTAIVLPLLNAGLAGFCWLCAVVYPDTQRFYFNLAFYALVIALLDGHIGWRGYLARVAGLFAFIAFSASSPLSPTTWDSLLFGFVIGVVIIWHWRHFIADHLWATMLLAFYFWSLYWRPQAHPVSTLRVLISFLVLVAIHYWLWYIEHRREQRAAALRYAADYDHLTHAKSLSRFRQDCAAAMDRGAFALITFDIDFFKSVNDEYGHAAGDSVLTAMAELVEAYCRDAAVSLYRTGGEEFSLLLPATGELEDFTQGLWQAVRTHPFQAANHAVALTISLGATRVTKTDKVILDVLRRADNSLYLTKRRGRDGVTIDGNTLIAANDHDITRLFAYYTAPIVNLKTNETAANALVAAYFDRTTGSWRETATPNLTVATLIKIMQFNDALLSMQPVLHLTAEQFLDPTASAQLIAYQATRPVEEPLVLSLTERPALPDFIAATTRYHAAGIRVVIVSERFVPYAEARDVDLWLPHYDELQFDLNTLTNHFNEPDFARSLNQWQNRLARDHKHLIITGIDNRNDAQTIRELGIPYGRGRYFAEPALPRA